MENFISKNTRQATLFDMRQRTEVTIIFNLLIRTNIVLAVTDCYVPIFSKKLHPLIILIICILCVESDTG